MKRIIALLLLITLTEATLAEARACWLKPMPMLLLTEGVEGGIAPRQTPFQMFILPSAENSRLFVMRRREGQADYFRGQGPGLADLQKELAGLYELPKEKEPGLADPYGMKIALHSHDGQRCWVNDPPNGCIRGAATITPTAAQKATFASVVNRLEKLAELAREPISEKEYREQFSALFPQQ